MIIVMKQTAAISAGTELYNRLERAHKEGRLTDKETYYIIKD